MVDYKRQIKPLDSSLQSKKNEEILQGPKDSEPMGKGELSEWIVGAIEQVLGGELVIEHLDPAMAGRGVGKNIQIRPALLEKLMQAAEEAGLSPSEWVKLAVYHRMEKESPAGSSRV